MTNQLVLPIPVAGCCGYCHGPLVLQPAGDAACPDCRPRLAQISTDLEWVAFHRSARRRRKDRR